MERSEFETTSFCLSPHRHLKSGTYHTLVWILSQCYDHPQISLPQDPSPEMCRCGELVGPNSAVPYNSKAVDGSSGAACIKDIGFGDAQILLDEIKDKMQVEENGDLAKHDMVVCNSEEGTGEYDKGLDQQQILMDELEYIMKGDEILVQGNNDQSGADEFMNDRQEHVDVQQIVNEVPRSVVELQADKGECNLDVPEAFDSSVNRNMDSQVSIPVGDGEERNPELRTNAFEVENETQQKEMEVENLVHTNGIIGAHDYRPEDVEVEEGEISGDLEHVKESIDMSCDDVVVSNEKKEDEKQVSVDVTDKRSFPCNEKRGGTERFSESSSFNFNAVNHNISDRAVELKKIVRKETQCKSKTLAGGTAMMVTDADKYSSMPGAGRNKRKASRLSRDEEGIDSFSTWLDDSTVHKETVETKVIQKQGNTSKEKPDSGACNKKKRSTLTKERKAKKKQKDRKKRAEKNRQLGIRRLKLPLNLKPKTVNYCHHYLKGRCQEGDKCKFSHDTVPLTKSTKACCHFARNSCMKGDNCPFDHDLSKYPCDNFVAKRFCSRGDDCLFSHKIPPKEEGPPATSTCTPKLQPPPALPQASNSSEQLNNDQVSHQKIDALSNHGKVSSFKNIEQNVAKSVVKPPAVAPKGINCLFLGKSSVLESSKLNRDSTSPKRSSSRKFANQSEQIASDAVQNRDETPRRTPMASKGINFLSFGNAPLGNSSDKISADMFLNQENGVKSSLSNNFGLHEKSSSSLYGEKGAEVGNATTQRFLSSVQKSIDMQKQTQPAITPQGLNFLSTGKAYANNTFSNKQASLHSSEGDVINRSHEHQNTPDIPQNSSSFPQRLTDSSLALGHSSDHSAQGYYRSTLNSAQKALAFATKIEPKVKVNQSIVQ